jgi:hypothetical protein
MRHATRICQGETCFELTTREDLSCDTELSTSLKQVACMYYPAPYARSCRGSQTRYSGTLLFCIRPKLVVSGCDARQGWNQTMQSPMMHLECFKGLPRIWDIPAAHNGDKARERYQGWNTDMDVVCITGYSFSLTSQQNWIDMQRNS